MTDIHVTIDRLTLEGIDPGAGGARLGAAVAAELGRLLAEGGLATEWRGGGARRAVRGGAVDAAAGGPDALAANIAAAIYGGLGE